MFRTEIIVAKAFYQEKRKVQAFKFENSSGLFPISKSRKLALTLFRELGVNNRNIKSRADE